MSKDNREELKSCPFCGDKVRYRKSDGEGVCKTTHYINCDNCGLEMFDITEKGLIDNWNWRNGEVTTDSGADEKLYIVERWGVYQQGIVGVFDSWNLAEEAKNKASSNECDDYHLFEIREFTLNEMQELFSIKKDYRDHTSFQKYDYK